MHLIGLLLEGRLSYTADTHPAVWVNAFDQPEASRVMLSFLNYQTEQPPVPVPVRFAVRPPAGRRFVSLHRVAGKDSPAFRVADDGTLRAELEQVELLAMVCVRVKFKQPGGSP